MRSSKFGFERHSIFSSFRNRNDWHFRTFELQTRTMDAQLNCLDPLRTFPTTKYSPGVCVSWRRHFGIRIWFLKRRFQTGFRFVDLFRTLRCRSCHRILSTGRVGSQQSALQHGKKLHAVSTLVRSIFCFVSEGNSMVIAQSIERMRFGPKMNLPQSWRVFDSVFSQRSSKSTIYDDLEQYVAFRASDTSCSANENYRHVLKNILPSAIELLWSTNAWVQHNNCYTSVFFPAIWKSPDLFWNQSSRILVFVVFTLSAPQAPPNAFFGSK